jgi:tRNA(Arg) A34 adenosine deaminase TadA
MLFDHGLQARGEGNYGIAAMAIWRPGTVADENGKIVIRPADEKKDWLEIAVTKPEMANQPVEIIVFGHNQLISRYNPNGHAERVATKKLSHLMARLDDDQVGGYLNTLEKESQIMFRPATTTEASIGMATTLEPCIGCTEEIMTTGYDWVLSLNEDPWAGGMHDDRRQKLATIWSETLPKANNLQIIFAQAENDQDLLTYLPAELAEINNQLFEQTRVALDEVLGSGGIFGQIPWARNGK